MNNIRKFGLAAILTAGLTSTVFAQKPEENRAGSRARGDAVRNQQNQYIPEERSVR